MSRIRRRVPVVVVLAVFAATPVFALAASPSYYVLGHAKAHCRSGYTKKTVTITVKHRHHKVKRHQLRCVKKSAKSGGSGVTFPSGLPTVTVTPTLVPTATGHTYATTAGQTLTVGTPGVLAGASGHGLTAQLVSGTASGTLTLHKDGSFTYAPAGGASGIVHFTYKVADLDTATSKPATVTVEVSPVAAGASYSVASAGTLTLSAVQVLAADTGTGLTPEVVSTTSHGSLSLGVGGMTYSPTPGFYGTDSFTYNVVDADGLVSNTVGVTLNVGAGPPSVVPQAFTGAVGNTPLQVGGAHGGGAEVYQTASSPLLAGDSDPNGGGALTITPGTVSSARGGSVTVASDGSFAYTPPAGFDGPAADSFSYQVNTTEGTSASATATISFTATRVWYVNNAGANGNGTAGSPFNTLGAATAVAGSGDDIYLSTGSGPYAGGVVLANGVSLVGQGSALVVDNGTLASAGTPPVITNGSGDGVTVQGTSTVTGVDVTNATGDGVAVSGSGNVALQNMAITGSGVDGVDATSNASLTVTGSTITGSGAAGIADGGTGAQSFSIASDTIYGQPGAALALNGFSGGVNGEVQGIISETAIGDGSTSGTGGQGIRLSDASGAFVVAALGNTVGQVASGAGILVDGSAASEADFTLLPWVNSQNVSTPNTITVADSGAGNDGVSILGGAGTTCLNAAGNHITASGTGSYAMSLAAGAGTFNIEGLTGGTDAASVETYLETLTSPLNTLSGAAGGVLASVATYSVPPGACPTPSGLGITS